MQAEIYRPQIPGLFVTGTGTEVGKTVVACLIADQLRRLEAETSPRSRIGVCKPMATGCRKDRGDLVAADAEELAHAADFDPDIGDLSLVAPLRFREPLAPAVALQLKRGGPALRGDNVPVPWEVLSHSLQRLDEHCSHLVIEGIGGVMVPIEGPGKARHKRDYPRTVLDLMAAIGYPAVVVADAALGTLNHTALTVTALHARGIRVAGVVLNRYRAGTDDLAMQTNPQWIPAQTKVPILAIIPEGRWDVRDIHPAFREAIDVTDFRGFCRPGAPPKVRFSSPIPPEAR